MFGIFRKDKPDFGFERKLDALIALARLSGVSSGEMIGALSSHVVSVERQSLRAREMRQYGNNVISGNLPE
jgi:hypothetical protein